MWNLSSIPFATDLKNPERHSRASCQHCQASYHTAWNQTLTSGPFKAYYFSYFPHVFYEGLHVENRTRVHLFEIKSVRNNVLEILNIERIACYQVTTYVTSYEMHCAKRKTLNNVGSRLLLIVHICGLT